MIMVYDFINQHFNIFILTTIKSNLLCTTIVQFHPLRVH